MSCEGVILFSKSSTLKAIIGEVRISGGFVYVGGHSVKSEFKICRSLLGYCPQSNPLTPELTVEDHLVLYARIKGISKSLIHSEVQQMKSLLDLAKFARIRSSHLSGGTKRKLCLALALLGRPRVLLLDESAAGLDVLAMRSLWEIIRNLSKANNQTVILTTHSMEEAEAVASRIGIMARGQLRCLGSVQQLRDNHGQGYELLVTLKEPSQEEVNHLLADWHHERDEVMIDCKELCEKQSASFLFSFSNEFGHQCDHITSERFALWWATKISCETFFNMLTSKLGSQVEIIEELGKCLKLGIPQTVHIAKVFQVLEDESTKSQVEEYSVSQLSLESIFNRFAKESL